MEKGKESSWERVKERVGKEKDKDKGKAKIDDLQAEKTTGKTSGDFSATSQWRKVTPPSGIFTPSTSSPPQFSEAARNSIHNRFQRPTSTKALQVIAPNCPSKSSIEGCSASSKKVMWADAVGGTLTHTTLFHKEDPYPSSKGSDKSTLEVKRRTDKAYRKPSPFIPTDKKKSYKEALLTPIPTPSRKTPRPLNFNTFPYPLTPGSTIFRGRCFRCLSTNHWASTCRRPLRCVRCFKAGHVARDCMDRLPMEVYRAMRARPSYLSAFVPLTDDFYTRQNRCRNAILADVLPPRTLGHFPQETIANSLASRFGGFPTDFHVAKCSERDFVIFLPEWVPCEQLIRREIISLDGLRLQCFPWNPFFGARRALLTYNVWIRLVSLPYECWSSRTVAALVGGFGRFIRADDFSIRMVDLTGYRCLISVNHLSDIPENLEITVGEYSRSVLIQLERWGRRDVVAPGNPPTKGRTSTIHSREIPRLIAAQLDQAEGDGRRPEGLQAMKRLGILLKSEIDGGRSNPRIAISVGIYPPSRPTPHG
uniref:CCHC-type domain-containing protein n=1 Tax=Ananas comosus var. bracteatus TaxID=296719 RepID=A0A6V7NTE8_ANACO|nr:unnamed protein product [Ananas comosus var. bracteatus]